MALGQIINADPTVRVRVKECKRCSILFITHPCNANRDDLCCPFGCREIRKRENNNKRSKKYYKRHKNRKKIRNRKRYLKKVQRDEVQDKKPDGVSENNQEEKPIEVDDGIFISVKIFRYICMVINTIELQKVSEEQILTLLRKKWRQHRLVCSRNCCRVRDG